MFEQDRILTRLQQRVMADREIVVCFLSGSYGRRQEDAYSDLDVTLVFANEAARETAWQRRRDFAQSVSPYVPAKSFDAAEKRPYLHHTLYSNGTAVEYQYEALDTLAPIPQNREIRILKDRDGRAEQYRQACAGAILPQPRLTAEALKALDDRFWISYWRVLRQLLRGDYDAPFTSYLALLNFILPPFLAVLPPEEPARQALINLFYNHDTRETAAHLRHLLENYLAARAAVVRRLQLNFQPDTRFETEIQRLVQNKTR